jgi:perosamine synthetase
MSTAYEIGKSTGKCSIPLCIPEIRGNEWKYVKDCLDTGWVSSVGSYVDRFEREMAEYIGTKHAVATVNGTAALHISLLVTDVQADDEVLVSTLSFIAPANAVRYVGAWPVFIDAEPDYWQMDPQKVVDFLEKRCRWVNGEMRNNDTGRRVKAILPVHILGHPVDIDPVLEIAEKYGLVVVEDATESLGAKYKGRMVGHLGDIACFSFNGNKIITTGGGGMIVTDNEAWAHKARYLTTQAKDDPIEYIHKEIGYNYRLTNVQAAMGCAQLEHLDRHIENKRNIAMKYAEAFENIKGIIPMKQAEWASSIYWLYTILVNEEDFGLTSRELMRMLAKEQIETRPLWQPLNQSVVLKSLSKTNCSVSQYLYANALTLPSSVGLSIEDQNRIINSLDRFRASLSPVDDAS